MREDEELKAPRHTSAAAARDGNLPLRDGNLPHPDTGNSSFVVAIYI